MRGWGQSPGPSVPNPTINKACLCYLLQSSQLNDVRTVIEGKIRVASNETSSVYRVPLRVLECKSKLGISNCKSLITRNK